MAKKVVIVGGGASGLMAAIYAAKNQAKVIVIEHKDRVGKKILMTGNGKCNLTNMSDLHGKYHSDSLPFVYHILESFDAKKVRAFFEEAGLYTKEKRDGGVYPVSEQAAIVLDTLRMECARLGVELRTNCHAYQIETKDTHGVLYYEQEGEQKQKLQQPFDALILATGSKAAPVSGSDGSGYELAKQIGHHILQPLPALVQLRCKGDFFKQVSGVRAQAKLTLYIEQKEKISEEGELQLTDYGISGIPTFQISRHVAKALAKKQKCEVHIDFLTYMSEKEVKKLLSKKQDFGYKTIEEFLSGLVHKKVAALICKQHGLKTSTTLSTLKADELAACLWNLKDYMVQVTATNSFENAQICCGGVPLAEMDVTMQSKKNKLIYLTGELLDCDGICGGYNLQWAWATGAIAGANAAKS